MARTKKAKVFRILLDARVSVGQYIEAAKRQRAWDREFPPLGRQRMTGASPVAASAEVISLADERASIRRRLLQRSAREVGEKAFARADHYDVDWRLSKRGHLCATRPRAS